MGTRAGRDGQDHKPGRSSRVPTALFSLLCNSKTTEQIEIARKGGGGQASPRCLRSRRTTPSVPCSLRSVLPLPAQAQVEMRARQSSEREAIIREQKLTIERLQQELASFSARISMRSDTEAQLLDSSIDAARYAAVRDENSKLRAQLGALQRNLGTRARRAEESERRYQVTLDRMAADTAFTNGRYSPVVSENGAGAAAVWRERAERQVALNQALEAELRSTRAQFKEFLQLVARQNAGGFFSDGELAAKARVRLDRLAGSPRLAGRISPRLSPRLAASSRRMLRVPNLLEDAVPNTFSTTRSLVNASRASEQARRELELEADLRALEHRRDRWYLT